MYEGPSLGRQAAVHGDALWERKPDLCCSIRKVEPLNRALAGLDCWITGLRRDQSPTRANAPKLGWDEAHELWKANPLADWTDEQCWAYIRERDLPVNPLHERGYASIGCTHCTRPASGVRAAGPVWTRSSAACTPRDEHPRPDFSQVAAVGDVVTGFVIWFTGLSASGKTTIANIVEPELERRGYVVDHLDGDIVRTHLSKGLGYSKEDRDANIARIGWVASRLARAGAAVVVSAISPYEEARRHARSLVEQHAPFVEVHVATPIEECARRDPKGLYAQAFAGELEDFTGVSAPYEEPRASRAAPRHDRRDADRVGRARARAARGAAACSSRRRRVRVSAGDAACRSSRTSTSSRPRRSTSCARSPPSSSGRCCSSPAARTRSCCSGSPRRRSGRASSRSR